MGRSPSPHLLKGPRGVSATATATATWPSPWSLTGRSLTPPGGCTGPQKVKTLLALLPDPQASGLGWHTEGLPRALPSTSILPTPTWGLDLCDRKLFKGGAWPGGSKMHPEWQPLEGAVSQDLWASASPLKTKGWWVSSAAPAAPGPSFQKVVIHQRLRKALSALTTSWLRPRSSRPPPPTSPRDVTSRGHLFTCVVSTMVGQKAVTMTTEGRGGFIQGKQRPREGQPPAAGHTTWSWGVGWTPGPRPPLPTTHLLTAPKPRVSLYPEHPRAQPLCRSPCSHWTLPTEGSSPGTAGPPGSLR